MLQIDDFNDRDNRTASASALLQKAIYHVFVLRHSQESDQFAMVLRMYQALYQLCSAMLLLDFPVDLNRWARRLRNRNLRQRCRDADRPTRSEIDPAAVLNHSVFDAGGPWQGFQTGHPLHAASVAALALCRRVLEARHNLIYRPFLLEKPTGGRYWEDCPLSDFLAASPSVDEVEQVYTQVSTALVDEFIRQKRQQQQLLADLQTGALSSNGLPATPRPWAMWLFQDIFEVYQDARDNRPTETILFSYARLLNGDGQSFLDGLANYRNAVFQIERIGPIAGFPQDMESR